MVGNALTPTPHSKLRGLGSMYSFILMTNIADSVLKYREMLLGAGLQLRVTAMGMAMTVMQM